jgi:hypothetical protein
MLLRHLGEYEVVDLIGEGLRIRGEEQQQSQPQIA